MKVYFNPNSTTLAIMMTLIGHMGKRKTFLFSRSKASSFHMFAHGFDISKTKYISGRTFTSLNMNKDEDANDILAKRLLSVQECIDIHKSKNDNVVFIDGSWHLDKSRNGRTEYEAGPRISNARYFDIDDISSPKGSELNPTGLPHMRPSKETFEAAMTAMKIKKSDDIIFYGTEGCLFIYRGGYILQSMGHDPSKIHYMQGSLQEWMDLGGSVDTESVELFNTSELDLTNIEYEGSDASQFYDYEDVLAVIQKNVDNAKDVDAIVVDARGAARFKAEAPEPREGMRSGHMPGSVNVPFMSLLDPSNKLKFKPPSELRKTFESAGIDVDDADKKLILSCGSGVSACILSTALEECGRDPSSTFLYDGSWSDWGSRSDTPIVS